jgi:hypothetical protein
MLLNGSVGFKIISLSICRTSLFLRECRLGAIFWFTHIYTPNSHAFSKGSEISDSRQLVYKYALISQIVLYVLAN